MEDGRYPIAQPSILDGLTNGVGFHEVAEPQIAEIAEIVAQTVNDRDPIFTFGI
jgi:hypothetical protein